jgi:glyoxylase-like metal-dependent hydrolase (beta-lactamase superfamily II)
VRQETGADIVTHQRFRMIWDRSEPPDLDVEDVAELNPAAAAPRRRPWDPPPWGGEGHRFSFKRRMKMRAASVAPRLFKTPVPTRRLADAQVISLARREWVALHTPGHTQDHLCLFDPDGGVMLSGDHVLPTITPHIGGFHPNGDPLLDFFQSLDKVAAYGPDVKVVLPAHGHPFDDLAGRAKAIQEHHVGRLDLLRHATEELGRPANVQEMSTRLFSPRALGPMADSETFAHLEHLRRAGELERRELSHGYEYVKPG